MFIVVESPFKVNWISVLKIHRHKFHESEKNPICGERILYVIAFGVVNYFKVCSCVMLSFVQCFSCFVQQQILMFFRQTLEGRQILCSSNNSFPKYTEFGEIFMEILIQKFKMFINKDKLHPLDHGTI